MRWWWVLVGGGLGSLCRVALIEWFAARSGVFPWGVLAANSLGCLAIGLLFAASESRPMSDTARLALQGGFLGGFTTFSAFGYEKEHYELSRKIGEDRLFPAIRGLDAETEIVACGFSCRHQIEHCTRRRARHWVETLRGRL